MAIVTDYTDGTVTVGAGGTTLTGTGTAWKSADIRAGDTFMAKGLVVVVTADATSETSLSIEAWPGTALSGAAYRIRFQPDASRLTATARDLLVALASGNLASIADLESAADKMAYFTGTGTAALTDLTSFGRSVLGNTDGSLPKTQVPPIGGLTGADSVSTGATALGFVGGNKAAPYLRHTDDTLIQLLTSSVAAQVYLGKGAQAADAAKLGSQPPAYYMDIKTRLGFTPVQQGGGTGQLANKINIGWAGVDGLKAQVDAVDLGTIWTDALAGSSIAGSGYQKLPSGLIVQFGTVVITTGAGGRGTITLPMAFPTAHIAPIIVNGDAAQAASIFYCDPPFDNTSSFIFATSPAAVSAVVRVNYIALGY